MCRVDLYHTLGPNTVHICIIYNIYIYVYLYMYLSLSHLLGGLKYVSRTYFGPFGSQFKRSAVGHQWVEGGKLQDHPQMQTSRLFSIPQV